MGLRSWDAAPAPDEQATAVESGGILFFPRLAFVLEPDERRFLSEDIE